ncbi:TPA: hypothetical protein QDB48_000970 [Burkholderia vietnamiensis]|nr:hypothetical protein [Burkholderia vietnamiensis]
MDANSSAVGQFNFQLKQGSDTEISMTWLQDDGVTPMSLVGYSMELTIRAFVSNAAALLSMNSTAQSGSRIVLGGAAGTIDLIFDAADTAALPLGAVSVGNQFGGLPVYQLGVYDLRFTDPSGSIGYLLEGSITLDPRVT